MFTSQPDAKQAAHAALRGLLRLIPGTDAPSTGSLGNARHCSALAFGTGVRHWRATVPGAA